MLKRLRNLLWPEARAADEVSDEVERTRTIILERLEANHDDDKTRALARSVLKEMSDGLAGN